MGLFTGLAIVTNRPGLANDTELQFGLFQPSIHGSAAYELTGTFVFSIARTGPPGTIKIPLPDSSSIHSDCSYQWTSFTPTLTAWVGKNTPVKLDSLQLSRSPRLRDGALYSFTPNGVPDGAESLFVEVRLTQVVAAHISTAPRLSPGPVPALEEMFDARSLVDFHSRDLDSFDRMLDREYREMGDYVGPETRRLAAMVEWVKSHNEVRRTRQDSAPLDSTPASQVVRDSVGDCFGFANLGQACFARMKVPSRAVLVARPKFEAFGNTATGHGIALHVLVEYCTSCGWGLMDPQVADNFAPPAIRIACADEARDLRPSTDTERFKYVRMTYDVIRDKRKGNFNTSGGGVGKGRKPYYLKATCYRQTDDPAPCDSVCAWVKSGQGCR